MNHKKCAWILAVVGAVSQGETLWTQNLSPADGALKTTPGEPAKNRSAAELKIDALTRQAALLDREGRYADAEALLREALSLTEETFGPTHVEVAVSASNLAAVLASEGQLPEAEGLYRRAVSIFEQNPTKDFGVSVALTYRGRHLRHRA